MKVLENSLIDLDLLPGESQQELHRMAQAQLGQTGEQVSQQIKERASQISSSLPEEQQEWLKKGVDKLSPQQKKKLEESIVAQMPEDQQAQANSYLGSTANVAKGAVGTVGTGVKGVADTLGNTVGALGSGLGNTAGGVYEGAKDTAGVGGEDKGQPSLEDVANAGQSSSTAAEPAKDVPESAAPAETDKGAEGDGPLSGPKVD